MNIPITDQEHKTIAFDFTNEGALRDGETISSPIVHSDPSGLTLGTSAVLAAPFYDSDGKKIAIGKGVKVRINGTVGTYTIVCRVTTSGGDILERGCTVTVTSTLA